MFPFIDPIEVFQAATHAVEEAVKKEIKTEVEVLKTGIEYAANLASGVTVSQPKDPTDGVLDFVQRMAEEAAPYMAAGLLGAPAVAFMSSEFLDGVISKININRPPTIRVCRTLPDLLIDSDLDPTGILRGGMNFYMGMLLPFNRPPVLCRDIPVEQVIDGVKDLLENLVSLVGVIGVASALKPVPEKLFHKVTLKEIHTNLDLKGLKEKIQNQKLSTH